MSEPLLVDNQHVRAPQTLDPLKNVWLINQLDPCPLNDAKAGISWARILVAIIVLFSPMVLLSAFPSLTLGGRLWGKGGLATDIGLLSILCFVTVALFLLPMARRALGTLIKDLVEQGLVGAALLTFDPKKSKQKGLLRWLEVLSRSEGAIGAGWLSFLVLDQLFIYWMFLRDQGSQWFCADAMPGSLFHFLAVGAKQPNLAGLWAFTIWGPIGLYLVVLIVRLHVVFSCLCSELANQGSLFIVASHPDRAGGLKLIGKYALLLSLFTFALGLDLAGMTFHELLINRDMGNLAGGVTANLKVLSGLWAAYLVLGGLLFFLPLLPLRRRMLAAKHAYLTEALKSRVKEEHHHLDQLKSTAIFGESLQKLDALDDRIRLAEAMATWPFDSETLVKYGGVLVTPMASLIAKHYPGILDLFKAHPGG